MPCRRTLAASPVARAQHLARAAMPSISVFRYSTASTRSIPKPKPRTPLRFASWPKASRRNRQGVRRRRRTVRVLRVDTYFQILLGTAVPTSTSSPTDADQLLDSTLKSLRDVYGLSFIRNQFSNSIQDEQDVTNFRIIVDYVISLFQDLGEQPSVLHAGEPEPERLLRNAARAQRRQLSVISRP